MTHDSSSTWNLTLTVSGLGLTLAGKSPNEHFSTYHVSTTSYTYLKVVTGIFVFYNNCQLQFYNNFQVFISWGDHEPRNGSTWEGLLIWEQRIFRDRLEIFNTDSLIISIFWEFDVKRVSIFYVIRCFSIR